MEPQPRPTRPGGCAIGCLLPVGAMAGLVLLWMAVIAVTNDEVPRPVQLHGTTLVGTWKGGSGSTLLLRPDGTYVATSICGMGYYGQAGDSKGTWAGSEDSTQSWGGGASISLAGMDVDGPELGGTLFGGMELDVTGSRANPVLWSFQGDPDDREVCRLHRVTAP